MNNDVKTHRTPSEILSEKITNTLLEKQLLLLSDIQKVQKSLSSGKLKAEDWRLLIEKAIDKGESNG